MKRICLLFLFFLLLKYSAFTQCVIPVIASVNPQVVCQGQQVNLSAQVIPSSCGISAGCSGNNVSSALGAGNTVQPGSAIQPPTILGNFNNSGRNEMLYLASELTPALGGACIIRSVSFNVAIFNTNQALNNFTLKLTCTNATSLNTWENNLTTVFYSASGINPAAGWGNTVTLNTPFAWDGVSNLIVDICWNSFAFGNQNNKAQCTNTAFNSYLTLSANTDLCGTNLAPNVYTLRPNIRFNYCFANINDYNVVWAPNTGINAVVRADTAITTATPNVNTSYIINVSDGTGCTGADTVSVQVDNSRVNAGADVNA